MKPGRSRASYKSHNYSGPKSNRKRVRAQLKRWHGDGVSRADVWRKKQKLDIPSTSLEVCTADFLLVFLHEMVPTVVPTHGQRKDIKLKNEEPPVPPADTLCRVCLVQHPKLFTVTNDLQNVYQTVTSEEYIKPDYPVCMCYTCLAELRRCHRFVETARDSNRVLERWYSQQNGIKMVHPFKTLAVTHVEIVSMGDEEVPSEQLLKTEVEDLQPEEFTNCNTDTDDKCKEIDNDNNNDSDTLQDDNGRQQEVECSPVDQATGTSGATSSSADTSNIIKNKKTENDHNTESNLRSNNDDKSVYLIKHCYLCTFKCVTEIDLTRHLRFHDSNRPHVCDVCQYRFEELKHLQKHKAMHEAVVTQETIKNGYFCNQCDFKGINELDLKDHTQLHTGEKRFSCDVCDYKCVNKRQLTEHIRTHTGEKPHTCHICDHKLRTKYRLKTHMKKHSGQKPFACDVCDFKSTLKTTLKNHILRHGDKTFLCEICSHKFSCLYGLQKHVKSKHTDEKPFSCKICNYKTARKDNLSTHMRTHTGEKPFSCDMCDSKYSHRVSLKQHLLTKHKIKVGATKTGST